MSPLTVAVLLLVAAYLVGAIPFGYLIGRLAASISSRPAAATSARPTPAACSADGRRARLRPRLPQGRRARRGDRAARASNSHRGPKRHWARSDVLRVGGRGAARSSGISSRSTSASAAARASRPARARSSCWCRARRRWRCWPGSPCCSRRGWSRSRRCVAVTILVLARLLGTPAPFAAEAPAGHPVPARRRRVGVREAPRERASGSLAGTENRIGDFPMRATHLAAVFTSLALGLWFGGAAFFNFVAACRSSIVRTGGERRPVRPHRGRDDHPGRTPPRNERRRLASALAGSAVGPVFPRYFAMQAVCGVVRARDRAGWWNAEGGRKVHRWRVYPDRGRAC